jgi:hypothetical protein
MDKAGPDFYRPPFFIDLYIYPPIYYFRAGFQLGAKILHLGFLGPGCFCRYPFDSVDGPDLRSGQYGFWGSSCLGHYQIRF